MLRSPSKDGNNFLSTRFCKSLSPSSAMAVSVILSRLLMTRSTSGRLAELA